MWEAFISILAVLIVTAPHLTGSTGTEPVGKDGFNFYKDYLRGRTDDEGVVLTPVADRMLYFYRTPMQLQSGLFHAALDQEYKKRTGNAFKNHMLSKEPWAEYEGQIQKRNSKTALSIIMANKHNPYQMDGNQGDERFDVPMVV